MLLVRTLASTVVIVCAVSYVLPADGSAFRSPGQGCDILVTISFVDRELREILSAFDEVSGLEFVVSLEVDLSRRVSSHLDGIPASEAMATVLEEAGLEWERCGSTIIVRPHPPSPAVCTDS